MSIYKYIKRISRGGLVIFGRRVVQAKFGYLPLKRELISAWRHRQLVTRLLDQQKTAPDQRPHLSNRTELQALLRAPALINDPEIAIFERYAASATGPIVEIGAAYGGSSLLFLLNCPIGTEVYSIDPFIKDSMGEFQADENICRSHVRAALQALNLGEQAKTWHLIADYSYNYVKNWTKPIAVLFIDGDHTYTAVKQDFSDWFPYLADGGIIFFHDSRRLESVAGDGYDHGWPGPSQLVRELQQDSRLTEIDSTYSITVFRKNHA